MHTVAHLLLVLGLLGVLEFVALSFSAHQLAGTAVPRLRRRIQSPLVRNARAWTLLSAAVAAAGLALLPV